MPTCRNNIPGIPGYVIAISQEELNGSPDWDAVLRGSGGFMVTYIVENICGVENWEPQDCIVVHEPLAELMSKDQLMAVLYHEAGHLFHDHAKLARELPPGELLVNPTLETEADAYALRYVEPQTLLSAIRVMIDTMAAWYENRGKGKSKEENLKMLLEHESTVIRFKHLTEAIER